MNDIFVSPKTDGSLKKCPTDLSNIEGNSTRVKEIILNWTFY
jgi:hypothetical protein